MYNFKAHGISVLNPVSIEKEYLDFTVDYAIKNKYNHFQFIGPIHENVKGNIDGMTFYKKYAQFNNEKDANYVNYNLDCVNVALEKLHNAGIKSYMWHHELELPVAFQDAFPEILNSDGDIEVSHPLVKDFLENKIKDFIEITETFQQKNISKIASQIIDKGSVKVEEFIMQALYEIKTKKR